MFAVTPSYALREVYAKKPDGSMKSNWTPCRALGVMKNEDGELSYVVEYVQDGITYLGEESYIKRQEPGNPL